MSTVDVFGRSVIATGPRGLPGPKGENGAIADPTSSYETYVKYINLRRKTLHSILALVNITSDLTPYTDRHYIQSVLESNTTRNFFYWRLQPFKDKYIALEFQKPVWLKQLQFATHSHESWTLHFTWQYSDDGKTWEQIGNEYNKTFSTVTLPPVTSPFEMFTFPQDIPKLKNKRHIHWRMHGLGGTITTSPFLNVAFIDLEL